ncbi:MAG: GNAT family N-acetyltransferase [Actinomycetota bacterium]|nr:GNAT family N-acetyltransferase [Actinomycetota bacterium]
MSEIEIVHPLPVEEARPWARTMATTFLEETQGDEFERYLDSLRRDWAADRTWGARAHGRWIATLATNARAITVPGPQGTSRDVMVDALTAVTVNATHRRRGLLTRMLSESLREARERNDPFSILIAAEWPIYGRFGYAPATSSATYTYLCRRSRVQPTGSGVVRQVDPSDLRDIAPQVFERARALRSGQVSRPGDWWPRRLGLDGRQTLQRGKTPNVYLHESNHGPDGLLWWASEREFDVTGNLGAITVSDLVASTDVAYRDLWAYLGGIDAVEEITLARRPIDEPVRWLLSDGRALRQTHAGDDVWIRLLDVCASLAGRSYAASGRLVLDVVDDDGTGYAAGRFLLEADGGDSACRPTEQSPDLRLTQRRLASIYLGGFSLRQLAIGGGIEELTSGAIQRADAMFATELAPWNATNF